MVNDEILYIRRRLKKKMDEDRFEHTMGVAYTVQSVFRMILNLINAGATIFRFQKHRNRIRRFFMQSSALLSLPTATRSKTGIY